ncbi:MAG TPA: YCF48-related protein [Bacteroidia bacterium]|nr:YCF48-related protein [Bacteroidia bacterium]
MKTNLIKTATFYSVMHLLILFVAANNVQAQNWTQIQSGTLKKINTICFSSATIGYLGGNDSLFMKTTNGGLTWSQINFTGVNFFPSGAHILNLQFLNDNVGFMTVGPYSGSYGTTDGGLTWNPISLPGNLCNNQGMYFFDENNGFIAGSGCFQGELISNVTGANWQTGTWNLSNLNAPTLLPDNIITDIDFYDNSYGLAVSKSGYVFRTTNGGANWDSISTPAPLNALTSVLIVNDTLAYAGYETQNTGFGLYVTTDAGLTWNFDMNSATFFYPNFYTLHQSNDGTVYTGGAAPFQQVGLIFKNPGQFMIWDYDQVDQEIFDIASHSDSIVFAVGDSGYIVVNHPNLLTNSTSKQKIDNNIQIYPNPTKNILFLKRNYNDAMPLNYLIFNNLGALVKNGTTQFDVDVQDLNSGFYFIEIQSSNKIFKHKFIIE